MTINIDKIINKFSDVMSQAKFHAAFFADVIAVIESAFGCKIRLLVGDTEDNPVASFCFTQELMVNLPGTNKPTQLTEHIIIVPPINREKIDLIRFGVAHELGHLALHYYPEGPKNKVFCKVDGFSDNVYITQSSKQQEVEADLFALLLTASKGKVISRESVNLDRLIDIYKSMGGELPHELDLAMILQKLELLAEN